MTRKTDNFGAFWQSMGIHRASLWTRVIGIIVLVLAAVRLFGSTPYAMDLKLADEAKYLYDGVHLLELGRLDPQWSPLYAVWYFGLMKLLGIHDTVQLFYTSYILLSTLIPLAVFIYLSRLQVKPAIALIAALLVLLSISNLMVFPYPGKAAILALLVFLILSTLGEPETALDPGAHRAGGNLLRTSGAVHGFSASAHPIDSRSAYQGD